jgi:hypothetical protein
MKKGTESGPLLVAVGKAAGCPAAGGLGGGLELSLPEWSLWGLAANAAGMAPAG